VVLARLDEQSGGEIGMKRGKVWSASHGAKREDKASNARGAMLGHYRALLDDDGPAETWSDTRVKAVSRMGVGWARAGTEVLGAWPGCLEPDLGCVWFTS
jgi:hypothetical protein